MKFSNLSISIFLMIIFSSCFSNKEISSFQQVKKEEQIKINYLVDSNLIDKSDILQILLGNLDDQTQIQVNTLNINVNYNATAFLNTINTNSAITAKVSIVCPGGNFVIPPPTTFSIWQLGCNSESLIKFENGSFFSPSFIEDKKSYVIKYEKPVTSGNPTKIYDTLYFDSTVPETTIKDEKSGYWTGSLKYNTTNGFTIDIILDNKKLRYSIPNCN